MHDNDKILDKISKALVATASCLILFPTIVSADNSADSSSTTTVSSTENTDPVLGKTIAVTTDFNGFYGTATDGTSADTEEYYKDQNGDDITSLSIEVTSTGSATLLNQDGTVVTKMTSPSGYDEAYGKESDGSEGMLIGTLPTSTKGATYTVSVNYYPDLEKAYLILTSGSETDITSFEYDEDSNSFTNQATYQTLPDEAPGVTTGSDSSSSSSSASGSSSSESSPDSSASSDSSSSSSNTDSSEPSSSASSADSSTSSSSADSSSSASDGSSGSSSSEVSSSTSSSSAASTDGTSSATSSVSPDNVSSNIDDSTSSVAKSSSQSPTSSNTKSKSSSGQTLVNGGEKNDAAPWYLSGIVAFIAGIGTAIFRKIHGLR